MAAPEGRLKLDTDAHTPARRATIGGWLSKPQGKEFEAYAAEIGLDLAALATILIVKELNHDRLAGLVAPKPTSRTDKGRRISARTKQADLKRRFADHAAKHGLSSDAAASVLFRCELSERWLGKCLGLSGEST